MIHATIKQNLSMTYVMRDMSDFMIQKTCAICNEIFETKSHQAKYCKNCKKKADTLRQRKHRRKDESKMIAVFSSDDIRNKEPYCNVWNNIAKAFQIKWKKEQKTFEKIEQEEKNILEKKNLFKEDIEHSRKRIADKIIKLRALTYSELKDASGLNETDFLKHYHAWLRHGLIKKITIKDKYPVYAMNDGFKYDYFRQYHTKIVQNTNVDNIMPSKYGNHLFYFQDIDVNEILTYSELNNAFNEINQDIDTILYYKMEILLRSIVRRKLYDFWNKFISEYSEKPIFLLYLWIRVLALSHDNFLFYLEGTHVDNNELTKLLSLFYSGEKDLLIKNLSLIKERRDENLKNLIISAMCDYINIAYSDVNFHSEKISKIIQKNRKFINDIYSQMLAIKNHVFRYTLAIDNIDDLEDDKYRGTQRDLSSSLDSFHRAVASDSIGSFNKDFEIEECTISQRKSDILKQDFKNICLSFALGKKGRDYITTFYPDFDKESPSYELFISLAEEGFVPGKKSKRKSFFTSSNFFISQKEKLENISLIKGRKDKVVFIPKDAFDPENFHFCHAGSPFENLNDLNKYLDLAINIFPMPSMKSLSNKNTN